MKVKIILIICWLFVNLSYSQVKDTITTAYVAVESYEINYNTIEKIEYPNASEYQGSYHFGESEGESQLEIIYSNSKFFARSKYGEWKQDGSWVLRNERQKIQYKNHTVEIEGNIYELYMCIKTTYSTLNEGQNGLVTHLFEDQNNKIYHYVQFNEDTKVEIPNGVYPEASFVKFTTEDVKTLSKKQLKIMRNEIFARHGYTFKKGGEMEQYFLQKEWYRLLEKTNTPNLTDIEKHNVTLILKLENS